MLFKVIAVDLDGTIALNDQVKASTWQILREANASGFAIFLVTGRTLHELPTLGPFEEICEVIIAENGAALYFPSTESVVLPFGHLAPEVMQRIASLPIPQSRGMAIAATWTPHDREIQQILSETGYAATIEYNKGAVMVLPPGATKGTGLMVALRELGYSPHNVLAFGDAENDRSFFEQVELAVAVSNAAPAIKNIADYVLDQPNGQGVETFIKDLLKGCIPRHIATRPDRQLNLGQFPSGDRLVLNPLYVTVGNMGIFGSSGSGKSWLAGLIAEKLLQLDYQVCIVDPEGDYRGIKAFPNTLLLGSTESSPPKGSEVSTLLEYSNLNLVLDLSIYQTDEKIAYVNDLLKTISNLRENRGKPHWLLIDESHYFCQDPDAPITKLLHDRMSSGGYTLVSYKPSMMDAQVLDHLDCMLLTRLNDIREAERLEELLPYTPEGQNLYEILRNLTDKQAFFCARHDLNNLSTKQSVIEFHQVRRKVPHIRHLHKYLRAPLPQHKQFHFDQTKTGGEKYSAASIYDFLRLIPTLPITALKYHLHRGDLEAWCKYILHDDELAKRLRKIANRKMASGEIRDAMLNAVSSRFQELEKLI